MDVVSSLDIKGWIYIDTCYIIISMVNVYLKYQIWNIFISNAEERRALKATVALSSGDLPDDQKWVKDKLSEIHSQDTTGESSPKKRKLEWMSDFKL